MRKLIAAYVRMKKREQKELIAEQETERVRKLKEEQRLARLGEQRENRERKQHLLSITWTKKERLEFARCYSFVGGAPLRNGEKDWSLVLLRARLSKKAEKKTGV